MLAVTATDPSELDRINDEVHDWFYDPDDVRFDRQSSEVVVPFRRWNRAEAQVVPVAKARPTRWLRRPFSTDWEVPWHRWILRIHKARSYDLVDKAGIGTADLNVVRYDPEARVVTVVGALVTISVPVSQLRVSVEETDQVIGLARYSTWFGLGGPSMGGVVSPP